MPCATRIQGSGWHVIGDLMLFRLPEILVAETAGRAMALRISRPVEIGVAPCLAGAAALAAARHLSNRRVPVNVVLTEEPGEGTSAFAVNLHVLKALNVPVNLEEGAEGDYPCVIAGTDMTATLGSSSFLVAKSFLDPAHELRWDGWRIDHNPYITQPAPDRYLSVAQARDIDRLAVLELGLPGICLMENAGIGAAAAAAELAEKNRAGGEVVVLAGPGNNGGDAFVVARGLIERGMAVRVVPLAQEYKAEALTNYRLLAQQEQFIDRCDTERLRGVLASARLVVDGIFGTGLSRAPDGVCAQVIGMVNAAGAPVLSLDVPSGLDADTGEVMGSCVKATRTISFAAAKRGLFLSCGADLAGEVLVADIGVSV